MEILHHRRHTSDHQTSWTNREEEFAATALDSEYKVFVVYVVTLSVDFGDEMHLSKGAQIAYLKADEAPTEVPNEYSDFADVFSPKLAAELPEHGISNHSIELIDDQQPPYGHIYSLGSVKLEILKPYIENDLANGFIRLSKSPAKALIFFNKKPDGSLRLCVDYWSLNYLTIKNWYPLPLVGESLDWVDPPERFTQLNLTNAYHRIKIRKGDEWKTAFKTCYSHFKYQVMLFGLTNVPATFHDYINKILAEKLDVFVIVYLNDILIYTENKGKEYVEVVQ